MLNAGGFPGILLFRPFSKGQVMLKLERREVGPFYSNSYLLWCDQTSEGIVVDAGDDAAAILDGVARNEVKVKAVINTHAHLDHIGALADVVKELGVPVFMHADDMPIYNSTPDQATMFGLPAPGLVEINRYLSDGEKIHFGDVTGEVIHTPGHSPGGVCLAFVDETPPVLIAGDVLFAGSIGRTDLPGADHAAMIRTLKEVIAAQPEDMVVYPGHGPETTIGREKLTNPFLAPLVE